jgi:hypothetical protein
MTDIKIKSTNVAGKVPHVSDIDDSELAMNTADGKLFLKRSDAGVDSIVEIGKTEIVDDLSSSDASKALSAAQGRVLSERIDTLSADNGVSMALALSIALG